MPSGSTHRKGIGAMFWVSWLVTARNISDGTAASASHSRCALTRGLLLDAVEALAGAETSVADLLARTAMAMPRSTNSPYAADHASAWTWVRRCGSTSTG